jgi:3'-5' exonuclease
VRRMVVDIETVPASFECGEWDEDRRRKAALDAITGRIVCIGTMLVEDYRANKATVFVGENESNLLRGFWSLLLECKTQRFIAHNGMSFDLPYLWRRSVILNVRPPFAIDLRKYRTDCVYDTMCVWGNWEMRTLTSLDMLSQALGVGSKSASGNDVFGLWQSGDYSTLAKYCLRDCWLTYACYCRMQFAIPLPQEAIREEVILAEDRATIRGHEVCAILT